MKIRNTTIRYLVLALTLSSTSAHAAPDHLEPISFTKLGDGLVAYMHSEIVYPKGMMHTHPFMIKDYSLSKSFSAIVFYEGYEYKKAGPHDNAPDIITKTNYFLVSRRSVPQEPFCPDLKYDPSTVKFREREIPIDEEFSVLMGDAWQSVLKQTRYEDGNKNIFTLDGTTYVFGFDRLCGMTGSPKPGTTLMMMISLSEQLEKLVSAEESDREEIRKKCIEMAKSIIKATNPNQRIDPTLKTAG